MATNSTTSKLSAAYRWDMTARVFLSLFGGAIWASTLGAFCAALFAWIGWMPLVQGVHIMTLFSFLAWCGVAMWVFYEASLKVITTRLVGSAGVFYLLFLLFKA